MRSVASRYMGDGALVTSGAVAAVAAPADLAPCGGMCAVGSEGRDGGEAVMKGMLIAVVWW